MNIEFISGHYKSIEAPLQWHNVPPLAILTGENGGGKSQLLMALNETLSPNKSTRDPAFSSLSIEIKNFTCQPTEVFYSANLSASIGGGWTGLSQLHDFYRPLLETSRPKNDIFAAEHSKSIISLVPKDLDPNDRLNYLLELKDYSLFYGNPNQLAQSVAHHFVTFWYDVVNLRVQGKSQEQIQQILGTPPWIELNDLFDLLGLPYRVNDPEGMDIKHNFSLELIDARVGERIKLGFLSSGESTIVRLIMLMYSNDKGRLRPKIFLLDEPDSHLHASLIHVFMNALQEVLVNRFGCRVIMVSHRTETLSFAPSESIFTMSRNTPRIVPANNNEQVIAMLSRNLLHVANKSVIIYVEDRADEEFFSNCVAVLEKSALWDEDFTPIFFTPALGASNIKGGQSVVRTWVAKLRQAGLKNVFGLIDRDRDNKGGKWCASVSEIFG